MNKSELAVKMVKDSGITKTDALKVIDGIINTITEEIKSNNKITLVGFGSFKLIRRKAKKGRNPRTGEAITIPGKNVVKFIPGKKLKELVN
jgi:DNA-binding protein HU-beta